jgi:ElaB/YqjD/DUF883 family membrane-anchored ribosome-binding protein
MERNFNDTFGGSNVGAGQSAGAGGTPSVGSPGGQGTSGAGGTGFGSGAERADTSFSGAPGSMGAGTTTERASEKLGKAKEKIGERATELKTSLADKLQEGAEKLRQRARGGAQYAGATGDGGVGIAQNDKMSQLTDKVAGGMQSTADWVRNADLESVKGDIERQVKEHPARSLVVAVGVGYLLGKAFRR